jgi:hypothetical protein
MTVRKYNRTLCGKLICDEYIHNIKGVVVLPQL